MYASPPGLIPACAGKTTVISMPIDREWAHPRVCGENVSMVWRLTPPTGSSPRVRGKPHRSGTDMLKSGLIPACAGKTYPKQDEHHPTRAHPRVCGENSHNMPPMCLIPGSSPRVRGKHHAVDAAALECGLIPACAGKTTVSWNRAWNGWAHPRVCGENRGARPFDQVIKGSSPRVRGKLKDAHASRELAGLIPACAGKTR